MAEQKASGTVARWAGNLAEHLAYPTVEHWAWRSVGLVVESLVGKMAALRAASLVEQSVAWLAAAMDIHLAVQLAVHLVE